MQLGLSPSEFWQMSPDELGEWYNAMRPEQVISGMRESQMQMLLDMIEANPEEYD